MINNEQQNQDLTEDKGSNKLKDVFSSVTANRKSLGFLIILIGVVVTLLGYYIFFGTSSNDDKKPEKETQTFKKDQGGDSDVKEVLSDTQPVTQPEQTTNSDNKKIEDIKSTQIMPLKEPTPPAPPPPTAPKIPIKPKIDVAPPPPVIDNAASGLKPPSDSDTKSIASNLGLNKSEQQAEKNKLNANIMAFGGGGGAGDDSNKSDDNKDNKDNNKNNKNGNNKGYEGFDGGVIDNYKLENTAAPNAVATRVNNRNRSILQGKVIDAVLETAVTTQLKGYVRAIIARDVYSDEGRNILIPKGSRVIGQYSNSVSPGQTRIGITWNRIITPYGIDIQIDSEGGDSLGRMGVTGTVDTKLKEQLFNAFLVSYVIPFATAKIANSGGNVSVTINGTSSTTVGSPESMALMQANQQFSQIATNAINNVMSLDPTISVNQGTKITVMVQKDLIFPEEALNLINKYNYSGDQ